ncbi:MAG TPA: glycosyltransferase family 2 protein [Caulobacteraceae bacterium]|nr:glycosyltransferase family 2 protein [Caulobacteraceae bacterium]
MLGTRRGAARLSEQATNQSVDQVAGLVARSRAGKRLSIVAPMHDEAPVLDGFFARIEAATADLGVDLEIVCVDDGSRDATLAALALRAGRDARVKVVALARNFGKEAALTAGIDAASGDMVVPIDADLQDPPELIAEFVRLWERGYDVVYGARADRSSDTALKRSSARLFYNFFNRVSDLAIPESAGDFRLMDRAVVEALKLLPERNRFMKGLFAWVGFRQIGVPYVRPRRLAGTSSFGYLRLLRFATDGITSFSTAPLRIWTGVGLAGALLAVLAALGLIVMVLVRGRQVPGYASLMVVILLGFAVQMIAFGVLGEYVGRLYQEVKGRPIYIVRARLGFD